MASNEVDFFMRDTMSDELLCRLVKPAPQVEVDFRKPLSNPFSKTDEWLVNGDLKEGLLKIRIYSSSGGPLPGHFSSQFAAKEFEDVFKGAINESSLKIRLFNMSYYSVVKNRVYRRTMDYVPWGGNLQGLLRRWEDDSLLSFNNDPVPHEALASIFRNFRRDNGKEYPYVNDWACSLFQTHHVDPERSAAWQQQHNFGVSAFSFPSLLILEKNYDKLYRFLIL
jgi:hypothetical protein